MTSTVLQSRDREGAVGNTTTLPRAVLLLLAALTLRADWPQFRGPAGDGTSPHKNVPTTWSETRNIAWKIELPGKGWSSPVLGAGGLWLTAATDGNRSLRALCIDPATGKIIRNVEVFKLSAAAGGHAKNSGASPTPILEGDRVYVHYGQYGTAALRSDGTVLWRNQSVKYDQVHGPGGSPVLFENLLIFSADGNEEQFVVALDKTSGREVWRRPRPSAMAYSTPLLIPGPQVVSPGAHRAVSYDPRTGRELWHVNYGDGFSNVPRPVFANGLVYLCTGFYQPELLAVPINSKGDATSAIKWRYGRGVPLTPSPLIVGAELYMVSDNGILTALDLATGKELWRERLGGSFSASLTLAAGHIYAVSEDGDTTVFAPGKAFKKVAANKLDGRFLASPATLDGVIFLRSDTHLYRIEGGRQ